MSQSTPPANLTIHFKPARIEIEAVVIRANAQREDLGVVASLQQGPLRRAWRAAQRRLTSWLGVVGRGRR